MTVIAYKDGVMAADSMVVDANDGIVGTISKIVRSSAGHLGASAGSSSSGERFRQWVLAGAEGEFDPRAGDLSFSAILVFPDGNVRIMAKDGTLIPVRATFHADGCGRYVALGAMYVGASAEEAVRAAIALESGCGGEVQVEVLR